MSRSNAEKSIKEFVWAKMPARLKKLVGAARTDLAYGPISKAEWKAEGISWPGYTSACGKIQDWFDNKIPGDLWVDTQSDYVQESEPEGWEDEETGEWVEPMWEDYTHFDRRAIMRAAFGDLVGNGLD